MNWTKLIGDLAAMLLLSVMVLTLVSNIFAKESIRPTIETDTTEVAKTRQRYCRYIPTVQEQWNTLNEFESTAGLIEVLTDHDWVSSSVSIQELDYILVLTRQLSNEFFPTVPTELVLAVLSVESDFRPDLLGFNDDSGLMQVIPKFHRERISKYLIDETSDIFDPRVNISTGMDYLEELLETTEGDVALTLMSYNEGPSRAKKRYSNGIVSEYAEEVIARMEVISDVLNRERQERVIESIINSKRGGAIDG